MKNKKTIAVIMHSVVNFKFFWIPIIHKLAEEFSIIVYVGNDDPEFLKTLDVPCRIVELPLRRRIEPLADLRALIALCQELRKERPDLVQTVTPKGGLLGMLASALVRVPKRVHTFQGQVWATRTGLSRWIFKYIDWFIARLSTSQLADSQTQLDFLRTEGVLTSEQGAVIGAGSISGVDLSRFHPAAKKEAELLGEIDNAANEWVIMFLGRMNIDKGLLILGEAFEIAQKRIARPLRLVLVGPDEADIEPILKQKIGSSLTTRGYTANPEHYIALSDVIVLPSFREGFGSILIEAAAMGKPTVASRIYGIDCAVRDRETGILVEPGNAEELANALVELATDGELYAAFAKQGREMAVSDFDQDTVIKALGHYYRQRLEA